ncbi:MAG: hypothetical protein JST79_00870 [Acidobacteria bacterium]|nr:hypothetical protein [Acidobacteriota bacterium]
MPNPSNPTGVTVRSYQVGFGDCFLLTFHYPEEDRYVLIDFGTTGTPDGKNKQRLLAIAKDIAKSCHNKLHAVVATHRHRDHISGFDTGGATSPGKIIRDCHPDVVVQPWTEDPKAKTNAVEATQTQVENFQLAFAQMHAFAGQALQEIARLKAFSTQDFGPLGFIGEDNLANAAAVRNLMTMGKKNFYVNAGSPSGLEAVLPGVRIWVLGPPTLKQSDLIRKERSSDPDEFWQLQNKFWTIQGKPPSAASLFPGHEARQLPLEARWFVEKAAQVRGDQLLQLVRVLDNAMNNTSVILLLEVNGKRLLLPGDAQIENWSYSLGKPQTTALLKSVSLYKVGHHGSRNATPKTLWNLFANRSTQASATRLKTMVSTMAGKFGSEKSKTEVPRKTLIAELKAKSDFFSTQELTGSALSPSHEETL